jgi:hypothetical protein
MGSRRHRVILADGCLDGPVLHEAAGVENGEGVSDMVLYGASAQRFAGRIEDRLALAPAGTPVAEVADVLRHVRWDMMISGCREVGATLVCHVSTGTPGVEAMTKRAEGVLVLAPASKDVDAILGTASGPLIALLGPDNGDAPPVARVDVEDSAVAVEAAPGPTEHASTPPLTVDDLPELPDSTVEDSEIPDAFSVSGLEGEQYQEQETPVTAAAEAPPEVDALPEVDTHAEVSVPLEGFDAGAGIEVGGGLDDAESLSDVESPQEPEFAGAVASDGIDFATNDLLIVDPVESAESVTGSAPGRRGRCRSRLLRLREHSRNYASRAGPILRASSRSFAR